VFFVTSWLNHFWIDKAFGRDRAMTFAFRGIGLLRHMRTTRAA
jgi:hypothetical protein